eukprot:2101616-Rhodomonas_salina.1
MLPSTHTTPQAALLQPPPSSQHRGQAMVRRPGSAVRCSSAGVRLWELLAPSQRTAHTARHQKRIGRRGGEEGRRGVRAAVCATLPRSLAHRASADARREGAGRPARCLTHVAPPSPDCTLPSPPASGRTASHQHLSLLPSLLGMLHATLRLALARESGARATALLPALPTLPPPSPFLSHAHGAW